MESIEHEDVFEKTFLELFLEKMRRRNRYSYVDTDYIDKSKNHMRRLQRQNIKTHDLQKHLERTIENVSEMLGFKNI